jgi:hypothetical protein
MLDCYKSYVMSASDDLGMLPDQFKTEDEDVGFLGTTWLMSKRKKRVLYQYTINCFHLNFWTLPPATLIPVKNALYAICAYQLNRHERSFGSGHLQDPTNLVCEQLKQWLFYLARHRMDDHETLISDVKKHIVYVKALEKNNVFPSSGCGIKHERTMNGTLLEVAGCLERACDEINESVQRRSLRDVVANVTKYTTSVVDSSLQYLFYILRSNKTPAAINIQTLKNGSYDSFNAIKNTRSFKLLETLLNSPYVRHINRQMVAEFREENVFSLHVKDMRILKHTDTAGAVNSEQSRERFYLNRLLGGNLIPDRNLLRRWIFGVHSGIDIYFQNKYSVLKDFVALHAVVERIAHFSIICRDMEELIDYFGMKIWAELGSKILEHFQEAFRRLNNEYRGHIQQIHAVARGHYDELVQGSKSNTYWRSNYNNADRLYGTLLRDMELSLAQMSQISVVIDRAKAPSHTLALQDKLKGVVLSLNQFGLFFQMPPITYPIQDQPRAALANS